MAAAVTLFRTARAAAPRGSVTAVDTHSHIFLRTLHFAQVHRYVPDYDATLEAYLGNLDSHGISHGVLIQPSFLGTDNSFLLEALRLHPDRLRGIAVVEPTAPGGDLDALAAAGIVGIRLNLIGEPLPELETGPWPALLRQVARLGWQVEVQREARDLPRIVPPLLASGVNVVVDHFGRPDPRLGVDDPGFRFLLEAAVTRRLWIKLSGAYRNGANGRGEEIAQAAIPFLRRAFGPERLLWGSDWPHTQFEKTASYSAARAELDAWIPDPAERTVILRDTPAKLFHFPTPMRHAT